MKKRTIVFDLDGTLVDTADDLVRSTEHALSTIGIKVTNRKVLRPAVSRGARGLIERGLNGAGSTLPDAEIEKLVTIFLAHYNDNIAVDSRPYAGAGEALQALKSAGARLAVCTNKREALSRKLLRQLHLHDMFDAIVGRDTLPVHKPDPGHLIGTVILADGDLGRSVLVGDSDVDIETARSASLPVIGVSFGYTDVPIHDLAPDVIIDHYSELAGAIRKVLP